MNRAPLLSLLLLATPFLHAREWTSADGRKIQGDFVSATATDVTVKMAGKDTRIPLSRLSAADQAWVKG
ncbi:MAG: y domain 1, partial [Prosthecobacter sp.]|nr:y domain 1 [Prosthecobacter sp.]